MVRYFCKGSTRFRPWTTSFLNLFQDLSENLSSNPKRFYDGKSLSSAVHDISQSGINLNHDFENISKSNFQLNRVLTLASLNKRNFFSFRLQNSQFILP